MDFSLVINASSRLETCLVKGKVTTTSSRCTQRKDYERKVHGRLNASWKISSLAVKLVPVTIIGLTIEKTSVIQTRPEQFDVF